ncbi:D-arabitol-phosphate dehydrogenase [Robinsoniella peoriensis]|uniref:D-arabitol-phosphate dehydrogenase n=2 Tax=Robinsoniella peoriensis TaxID=180332 RepID=A0A4U8Q192_9FIRM|nr:D-arabitol-phosphate dehydrogenase [Robinsoniella peoriensis]
MKGKSLVGSKGFQLELRERDLPTPGYNQVLIKIGVCGVCGSDLHLLSHQADLTPLGHEISGKVFQIGRAVSKVKIGDDVVVEDKTYCGRCTACKNGHIELCSDMHDLNGQSGMGEYICVHENMLHIFEGITPEEAAFTEPLAVCVNTYMTAQVPLHGKVVILGIGPLAIMCAALAVHYGASFVACVGSKEGTKRNKIREDAALAAGADTVTYMSCEHYKETLKLRAGGPIDAIIVTSPPSTIKEALDLADYGTRIVPIGLDLGENSKVQIDIDRIIMQKNTIVPFIAEPAGKFPLSLELIRDGVVNVKELITHEIPLEEAAVLKNLFHNDNGVIKVMIKMNKERSIGGMC